ncbi:MAG: hypothetical protein KC431_00110, partial [Myxococcales bacterium]|nr:hypothetical protein [Myxococcales bacterium]
FTTDGLSWQQLERRRPEAAGALELPEVLVGGSLLHAVDRRVSIWLAGGLLQRWDQGLGSGDEAVAGFPIFAVPPYWWFVTADGEAVVLLSASGAFYRADGEGVGAVSLETTACIVTGSPVISPRGDWAAWTCIDTTAADAAFTGAVVRVSAAEGLERFSGVPMTVLAIDDDGDLLLHSVQTTYSDQLDGIESQDLPRSLFVLSGRGVLTRIDDLEPAPTPVLAGSSELGAFIQAVALRDP